MWLCVVGVCYVILVCVGVVYVFDCVFGVFVGLDLDLFG